MATRKRKTSKRKTLNTGGPQRKRRAPRNKEGFVNAEHLNNQMWSWEEMPYNETARQAPPSRAGHDINVLRPLLPDLLISQNPCPYPFREPRFCAYTSPGFGHTPIGFSCVPVAFPTGLCDQPSPRDLGFHLRPCLQCRPQELTFCHQPHVQLNSVPNGHRMPALPPCQFNHLPIGLPVFPQPLYEFSHLQEGLGQASSWHNHLPRGIGHSQEPYVHHSQVPEASRAHEEPKLQPDPMISGLNQDWLCQEQDDRSTSLGYFAHFSPDLELTEIVSEVMGMDSSERDSWG